MRLVWDALVDRTVEGALDHGVLALSDGTCVPWNGLTSIAEKIEATESNHYYVDGVKKFDDSPLEDFGAILSALTYPDEFIEYGGLAEVETGLYLSDQKSGTFDLSYRTQKGSGLDGLDGGYRIHILYNLTAIPSDYSYETIAANDAAMEFSWELNSVPEALEGFRPSSHVIIDSADVPTDLLTSLETTLYGNEFFDPSIPSLESLHNTLVLYNGIMITDNGDGTWTALGPDSLVFMTSASAFQINSTRFTKLSSNQYVIWTSAE